MELFLPDLLYCDKKKTVDLLSVIVNDLVTEYTIKQSNENKNENGLEVNVNTSIGKIVARYKGDNNRSVEREGIVRLPTAALFTDLYTILNSKNKVQRLTGFDDAIIDQLQIGEFIEIDGTVSLSPVESALSSLVDLVNQFKGLFSEQAGTEQVTLLANLLKPKNATVILKPYNDVSTSFIASLNLTEDNLFAEHYEIEGEFTIFGRVRKITPEPGKVELIKFLPGKLRMKEDDMLKLFSGFNDISNHGFSFGNGIDFDEKSFYLDGPVIEISPIAVYQNS
ncbi:DUF6414 family protein [Paenibacillus sp. FSL K6-2441]|uniref:DUF6414 family protein n=1 Tax=Paenibacillus TaxID=44249 RepID=UPI0030DBC7E2